jgi:oligopeptide transport system substrate-binding protein
MLMQVQMARFLILIFTILVLAGCSNNPHPPPYRIAREDGTPWQVAYRGFPDDPRSLDPQVSYDNLGRDVIGQLYESAFEYDPFQIDPYQLIPSLAERMPDRIKNSDGTENYLIHFKEGIRFHDDPCFPDGKGREFTADDFVYAFKRMADPKVECPVVSVFEEIIVGFKEDYEEAQKAGAFDYSKSLRGIEVVDPYTARLHLTKAYPQIQYWLAMPFTAAVPHEAVEYYDGKVHDGKTRDQFKFHPVGTGPFQLVEWDRSRLIRLVRNSHYQTTYFPISGWAEEDDARFRPDAGKQLPIIDELQLSIIRESIPAWLLFRQGYLDTSGVGKDVFHTVLDVSLELTTEYKKRNIGLHRDVEPTTYYFVFNMEDPILGKNKKLRQALSSEFDEDLENAIFQNGININAQQLLPPGIYGYQPDFKNPYKQHDLVLAKKLIAEAGYPDGIDPNTGKALKINLDVVADDAESRQHAEFEKKQLEQIGVQIEIVENIWAKQQEKIDSGHFQIISFGWNADYPDPENFFFLFATKNIPPLGSNQARYSNPEFDRLFEEMSTMDNSPERLELIHKLNDILTEDCPGIWLMNYVRFALTQPWSPRIASNPMLAGGFKYVKVNSELRNQKQQEWNQPTLWPLFLIGLGLVVLGIFVIQWNREHNV